MQVSLALIFSWCWKQPKWWLLIHALFAPAVFVALMIALPPWVYLLSFVVAWLLFGRVDKTRVPLYLSNGTAINALKSFLPHNARFLDIGSGTGTVLVKLGREPGLQVTGIEYAWLPWLISYGRLKLTANPAIVIRGDLMTLSLADFDVVYAFLSPAVMPMIWRKVKAEMRSGSLFVSNSFTVPDVVADEVIELNDWKGACLYLWRMP